MVSFSNFFMSSMFIANSVYKVSYIFLEITLNTIIYKPIKQFRSWDKQIVLPWQQNCSLETATENNSYILYSNMKFKVASTDLRKTVS